MKTNHRDGTKKRQDQQPSFRGPIRFIKEETVHARRAAENRLLGALSRGNIDEDIISLAYTDRSTRFSSNHVASIDMVIFGRKK